MQHKTYISFDWALKRLLRDKANFDVLEGLLTTLLGQEIHIHRLLESESNREHADSKSNRVDLLAENDKGEKFIIEVQGESEFAFFQRILFGTSRLITEYINGGDNYESVQKVYSINILYFNLGQGTDVVYHGRTEFRGIHDNDVLQLSPFQKQKFEVDEVSQLFPEYYILRVNDFNRWSRVPLEQWMYFLSTSEIPDDADAPGLQAAREKMKYIRMTREEQAEYQHYMSDRAIIRDQIITAKGEGAIEGRAEGREEGLAEGRAKGLAEGRAEGLAEGRAEGLTEGLKKGKEEGMAEGIRKATIENARKMKEMGMADKMIVQVTGLGIDEIKQL